MHTNLTRRQKIGSVQLFAAAALFAALSITVQAGAQTYITIDAPGSGPCDCGYPGTWVWGINIWGTVTGTYTDSTGNTDSFVRTPDGKYADFSVTGAAGGTFVNGINDSGTVTGYWSDANYMSHGFVRTSDGEIATFDAPGGVGGTSALSINDLGVVAGYYYDSNTVVHGFLRTPDGKITSFDNPASGSSSPYMGTWAFSLNNLGAVAGASTDSSYGSHGFVRAPNGTFTTFNFPGNVEAPNNNAIINDLGVVAGTFGTISGDVGTGYQRTPDGKITVYEVPGAGSGNGEGTFVTAQNVLGAVTGNMNPASDVQYNFVRDAFGKTTVFAVPGQILSPGCFCSSGESINALGVVAGWWLDENYVAHGFVRLPH